MTVRVTLSVLVPKEGSRADGWIAPGSGIVTIDPQSDPVEVYFEGDLYRVQGLGTFEAKVHRAAERLVEHYPTVARGRYAREDFDVIGTYSFTAGYQNRQLLLTPYGQDLLAQWTARKEVPCGSSARGAN